MNDQAVPHPIRLVRDFVNTHEQQASTESLHGPDELRDWLAARGLLDAAAQLQPRDVTNAIIVREGIRAILAEHAGHAAEPAAIEALNDTLTELPVHLTFSADGYHLVTALSSPFEDALSQLLDAIRQCSEDGTWHRLKVCARDTCRWAFYDASRNQVRRWCSMAGCGNHIKMQWAYAQRKSRARQTAPESADVGR
jgi:predicted RNA-binding Zn ribbon-like protein